jgi:hypothetical protein
MSEQGVDPMHPSHAPSNRIRVRRPGLDGFELLGDLRNSLLPNLHVGASGALALLHKS